MTRLKEILIGVLLLACGLIFWGWLDRHDAALKAQSEIDAQQAVIKAKDDALAEAEKARDSIQADEHDHLGMLEAIRKEVPQQSPQQNTDALSGIIKAALELRTNPATGKQEVVLPDAPSQLPALLDQAYKCQECAVSLRARDLEVANLDSQVNTWTEKSLAQEAEVSALKKLHQSGRGKWFVIGSVVGGGIVAGLVHR